jgi:hypothetical protein
VCQHSETFSFQFATATQTETDRSWNAIACNGGTESARDWSKYQWSLSKQITPRVLTKAMAEGGEARVRSDDGNAQNRHRQNRGGGARRKQSDQVPTQKVIPCRSWRAAKPLAAVG